jgi:hypothetical protein
MVKLFGPHDAGHLLHLTGRLIGMQLYTDLAADFPALQHHSPQGFGAFLLELLRSQGDDADMTTANGNVTVTQAQWGLIAGVPDYHPACRKALMGLVEGLMNAHDRRLSLGLATAGPESVAGPLTWTIKSRPLGTTDDGRFPA